MIAVRTTTGDGQTQIDLTVREDNQDPDVLLLADGGQGRYQGLRERSSSLLPAVDLIADSDSADIVLIFENFIQQDVQFLE